VLNAQATPASIAGSYGMTITVDRACTNFPEQVRTRTYAVTLPSTAANAYFSIFPTGASFVPGWNQFDGGVSGNYVGFWFENARGGSCARQLLDDRHVCRRVRGPRTSHDYHDAGRWPDYLL
jgi:hypothetical protein